MSLGQLNIYGKDKVQVAIERIKAFEPEEGYHLAFSGGGHIGGRNNKNTEEA